MFLSNFLSDYDYRVAAEFLNQLDTRQFLAVVNTVLRILQRLNEHY